MSYLNQINSPTDLRKLSVSQLPILAQELREYIIDIVATKEGHLGASLGVVELTIALHFIYDTPNDILVWDVGHQAYGHKILTERKSVFHTNRQLGGVSGFPKQSESAYDHFGTGHSSTSISAVLGMALVSQLKKEDTKQHIAIIGDAAIAGGMAFEALNHAGETKANILVILNDNAIGIDPSVGALKKYLTNVKKGTAKDENIFECLNFHYEGPVDGHDIPSLIVAMERLKKVKGPKFLHVITTKGKGLKQAEENQVTYHAPGKFNKITGDLEPKNSDDLPPKYQDVFGETLLELALLNEKIVGITPAMPTGSSLGILMKALPHRAFDVGIAEQHAVTMAAGMATASYVPYCTIYSTFLQRGYDQIIHDVALQNLPVIFCLDRAGLVGQDGATHQGVYDIAYLRCIPNMIIAAPMNEVELRNMLFTAQYTTSPIAIRYPRGRGVTKHWKIPFEKIIIGKGIELKKGTKIAVLSVGPIGNMISEQYSNITKPDLVGHYNMRFVKPLDGALLRTIFNNYDHIITIEEGSIIGGFGEAVVAFANEHKLLKNPIKLFGIPDVFIDHGTTEEQYQMAKIDQQSVLEYINNLIQELPI